MKYSAIGLLVIGLLQMTGDLLDRAGLKSIGQPIKAIGAATTASPAPKVFTAVRGLETFSTRFDIEWHDRAGEKHTLTLTPEDQCADSRAVQSPKCLRRGAGFRARARRG